MEREYYMICLDCKDVICTNMGVRFSSYHDDYVKRHERDTGHKTATFSGVGVSGTHAIRKLLRGEE